MDKTIQRYQTPLATCKRNLFNYILMTKPIDNNNNNNNISNNSSLSIMTKNMEYEEKIKTLQQRINELDKTNLNLSQTLDVYIYYYYYFIIYYI